MKVYRLAVANHDFLQEMHDYLQALQRPDLFPVLPHTTCGDLRADIDAGPPADDRDKPLAFKRIRLQSPITLPSFPGGMLVSGLNYYPVGGSGLGWHTDSHAPGWRIYMGRPLSSLPGLLLAAETINGERQILSYDDVPGLAQAFYVSGLGRSWHAVDARGARFSMGVRIQSSATARAIGLPVVMDGET